MTDTEWTDSYNNWRASVLAIAPSFCVSDETANDYFSAVMLEKYELVSALLISELCDMKKPLNIHFIADRYQHDILHNASEAINVLPSDLVNFMDTTFFIDLSEFKMGKCDIVEIIDVMGFKTSFLREALLSLTQIFITKSIKEKVNFLFNIQYDTTTLTGVVKTYMIKEFLSYLCSTEYSLPVRIQDVYNTLPSHSSLSELAVAWYFTRMTVIDSGLITRWMVWHTDTREGFFTFMHILDAFNATNLSKVFQCK
jgi:hypothetical protein